MKERSEFEEQLSVQDLRWEMVSTYHGIEFILQRMGELEKAILDNLE